MLMLLQTLTPGHFQKTLKQEFGLPFDQRLNQDLLDGFISHVQDQIRE
jgi:hypothetical protein